MKQENPTARSGIPGLQAGEEVNERRAHWGDELIAAVSTKAVFEGTVTGRLHEVEVYAIIAIVEDWLTPRILDVAVGQTRRAITSELRVANAEAQVQAVRETCDNFVALRTGNPQVDQVLRAQMLKDADEVRRILGGASWEARTGGNDD